MSSAEGLERRPPWVQLTRFQLGRVSPISISLSSAPPRPFLHPHAPYLHIAVQVPKFHPLRKKGAGLVEGRDPDPSLHCELGFQELLRTASPEWLLVHLDT